MSDNKIERPIINSPYDEPKKHWKIKRHEPPELIPARRLPTYLYVAPNAQPRRGEETVGDEIEILKITKIREQLKRWRPLALRGEGGVTRITMELLNYWRREGRQQPLFFAQLEAAETIIFLTEARQDFRQGIEIPTDEVSDEQKAKGVSSFSRLCCKMATGSGKTTVMAMLAAWSILNKVNNKRDGRFAEAVLVVCPNVTIRERLAELCPQKGKASIYVTRDLVPPTMMPMLAQGKVLVTNWHVFEPQSGSSGRVVKTGKRVLVRETIYIGKQNTTARGRRYLTEEELKRQQMLGRITVHEGDENRKDGVLVSVQAESIKYIESDKALVDRVLKQSFGGQQNILVFNDEAHHAYRLQGDEAGDDTNLFGEAEEAERYYKQATVWVEGLDKIHQLRKINRCVDFSATPYFLQRAGKNTNRIFPWTVSNFGLQDAIESGLVKIPQLAVRDTTGAAVPGYLNIWHWIKGQLSAVEKGGKRAEPKPEAILRYAHTPLAMLGGLWEQKRQEWEQVGEARPPVFIIVCKTTKLAKVMYEWLAEDKPPLPSIPKMQLPSLVNTAEQTNTIRVDSKVKDEIERGYSKDDEGRWMRYVLDTIGKTAWHCDGQNKKLYPEGFVELLEKLMAKDATYGRFLEYPPGRDVRCIVSVGMLTEGWDCNTVTHIIGLRPFMSQLLCEQVIGRGLRRASYEVTEDGLMSEEVATVLGVPLTSFPIKGTGDPPTSTTNKNHIYALPKRAKYRITFPRVEGYYQQINHRVTCDVSSLPSLSIDGTKIPAEVEVKPALLDARGQATLHGPGAEITLTLEAYRTQYRQQKAMFELTRELVAHYLKGSCTVPANVLFGQIYNIIKVYIEQKLTLIGEAQQCDAFISRYYGEMVGYLQEGIRPDTTAGDAPELPHYEINRTQGSSDEVDFWTTRQPYNVKKSHVNAVVPDTKKLEQTVAYALDKHPQVQAFIKNEGLGFGIPYIYNGETHDYMPDFIIRLSNGVQLILETKGFDERKEVKKAAAQRWVNAVNADNKYGTWAYSMIEKINELNLTPFVKT